MVISLRKKVMVSLLAATVSVSALTVAPQAEAFDVASAIGAVIGVSAQYAALNQQVNYYDGKGRAAFMEDVKKKTGVNQDYQANEMLADVMTRLSAAIAKTDPSIKEKPYRYFVNNQNSFNAFCTLGHNMSVNIGLFKTLNYNEDEIAVVVGHEMGHGQRNDPANGIKNTFPIELLAAVAQSQAGNYGQVIGTGILANLGSAKLVTLPMEKKADELAFTYTEAAGYNVGAGAAVWQRVIEKMGENKSSFIGSIFNPSDHPGNMARRDKYSERLTAYSNNKVKVDGKTGAISLDNKLVGTPAKTSSMSSLERAYLIAGNMASVYHVKQAVAPVATEQNGALYLGDKDIMTVTAGDNGATWVQNLNLAAKHGTKSSSTTRFSKEKNEEKVVTKAKDSKTDKTEKETKIETSKSTKAAGYTPGSFRAKVEAARAAKEAATAKK